MKLKKLRSDVVTPKSQRVGDAGLDVYSIEAKVLTPGERYQFKLGFAIELNPSEVCLMQERSGMAIKHGVESIGNVVDSNYRGEISIILMNNGQLPYEVNKGDRIGQMVILELGDRVIEEVEELSVSERGDSAHYSSGV